MVGDVLLVVGEVGLASLVDVAASVVGLGVADDDEAEESVSDITSKALKTLVGEAVGCILVIVWVTVIAGRVDVTGTTEALGTTAAAMVSLEPSSPDSGTEVSSSVEVMSSESSEGSASAGSAVGASEPA